MSELNRLVVEFIQVGEEIKELSKRKKDLESEIKTLYEQILDACGTGKTVDEL